VARARGVAYELRILLPEAEALKPTLAPFGANDAFIAEGRAVLDKLCVESAEATGAKGRREDVTRKLRQAEAQLTKLLRQLEAADEAAAMERVDAGMRFPLEIIKTERARVEAQRQARLVARPKGTAATAPIDE
jgi:hypothetical protein